MAPATAEPEASAAAAPEAVPTEASPDAETVLADPLAAGKTLSLSRSTARAGEAALSAEDRGKRWLVAGAARRGRAGKHWSTRQRWGARRASKCGVPLPDSSPEAIW